MSADDIPAVITTAHLLLRGLVPAFVGCSIGSERIGDEPGGGVQASAFQMTYRKDLPKLGREGEWCGVSSADTPDAKWVRHARRWMAVFSSG